MYLGGELYDIDGIESDSDTKCSSGSEDDAEFEQYLSKSNNDLNKSIQSEIIRRNQKKKNKKQDTFEDEMEDELDSILLSLQKKYSFNFPSVVFSQKNKLNSETNTEDGLEMKTFHNKKNESHEDKPNKSNIKSAKSAKKRKSVTFAETASISGEKNDSDEKAQEAMEVEDYGSDYDENENNPNANDDLLYDPDMDNEDALWVENKRRKGRNMPSVSEKKEKAPNSDAVLDCPSCLSTLCLDCQRHEIYKNQYRAMFVMNCRPILTEELQYKAKTKRKKQKQEADNEIYHPVRCTECNTEVGVYDKDEIYHFFNILASRA